MDMHMYCTLNSSYLFFVTRNRIVPSISFQVQLYHYNFQGFTKAFMTTLYGLQMNDPLSMSAKICHLLL